MRKIKVSGPRPRSFPATPAVGRIDVRQRAVQAPNPNGGASRPAKAQPPAFAFSSADHYRNLLTIKQAELTTNLEDAKFDTLARLGRVAEEDQAQLTHDEFISLRLNNLDYQQLKLVQHALERLETGEFGICMACEEPISQKRLHALPWAKYCVACQELMAAQGDHFDRQDIPPEIQNTW